MRISLKTLLPVVALSTLSLSSCNSIDKRAKEYFANTKRTQEELNQFIKHTENSQKQSILDSIAYRDIFNSTQAVQDSDKVAEFNKIAENMRGYVSDSQWSQYTDIDRKLVNAGITVPEMMDIDSKEIASLSDAERINSKQHLADDWAYRKFFEKHKLMNDSLKKQCDEVSSQISPKQK